MALPELLEALRAQAATRRAEELARGDAEAERIREESRASMQRRKTQHVERAARGAQDAARRSLSEARLQAAESVLEARDRLLGRVRAALEERARTASTDHACRGAAAVELAGALERLPDGKVIVRARPELRDALAEVLRRRPDALLETHADVGSGFIALSPDTGVEIDGTLETKLEHRWPAIAVSVLTELGR